MNYMYLRTTVCLITFILLGSTFAGAQVVTPYR